MTTAVAIETVVRDLQQLVRIDSQSPGPQEAEVIAWLAQRLDRPGIRTRRQPVPGGGENLVFTVPGTGDAPRLVLSAHMDTVPVGDHWTVDPLGGELRDGAIWGRGSCDMKAGLAVAVATLEAFADGPAPPGDLVLAATVDEEGPSMRGVHALVADGLVGGDDQVLALEPTGLRLRIAQVGLRWLELVVHGRMSHAGRAHRDGIDANHLAALIVCELKERVGGLAGEHPLLGPPRCTAGVVHGGVATNVIPGSCRVELDVRVVPPAAPEDATALVREIADGVIARFPGSRYELRGLGVGRPPVVADDASPIVQGLRAAWEEVHDGARLPQGGEDGHEAYTDASMIAALTGSRSSTVWGPGLPKHAHVADEHVTVEQLETAVRVLERLVAAWGTPISGRTPEQEDRP
ncbi:M20 family metallopeptidase [Patulibacter defluvii]|uniref:M20 family metallopeptidase n=1 Tax=Patulibacter defluvii TaxID=3095358 RepID=UPI002A7642F1|nr:M20 family metallopeptidase [Patulibacter sp. DM4]